jgi:hypothetical protein
MSYGLSWDQPQLLCAGTAAAAIFGADHRGTLGRRQWQWEKLFIQTPGTYQARAGPIRRREEIKCFDSMIECSHFYRPRLPGWERPNPRAARYGPLLTLPAGGEGKKGGLSFIAGLVSGLSRG